MSFTSYDNLSPGLRQRMYQSISQQAPFVDKKAWAKFLGAGLGQHQWGPWKRSDYDHQQRLKARQWAKDLRILAKTQENYSELMARPIPELDPCKPSWVWHMNYGLVLLNTLVWTVWVVVSSFR